MKPTKEKSLSNNFLKFVFMDGISWVYDTKLNTPITKLSYFTIIWKSALELATLTNIILFIIYCATLYLHPADTPYNDKIVFSIWCTMINCKLILILVRLYKNYKMGKMTESDVLRGIPGDPGYEKIASNYLRRGDFIMLHRNQVVPCDCLILDSDDRYISNFVAYFKTNLNDGSTVLNMKKTLNLTKNLKYMDAKTNTYQADFSKFRRELCGNIEYSNAKTPWENFEAYVKLNNDPKVEKATIENVARKGAVLMSGLMIAMVLYVNEENRLMNWEKRSNKGKFRRSSLESWTNDFVFITLVFYWAVVVSTRFLSGVFTLRGEVLTIIHADFLSGINIVVYMIMYLPMIPGGISCLLDVLSIIMMLWGRKIFGRKLDQKEEVEENYWFTVNNFLNVTQFPQIDHVLVDKTNTLTKSKLLISSVFLKSNKFELQTEVSEVQKERIFDSIGENVGRSTTPLATGQGFVGRVFQRFNITGSLRDTDDAAKNARGLKSYLQKLQENTYFSVKKTKILLTTVKPEVIEDPRDRRSKKFKTSLAAGKHLNKLIPVRNKTPTPCNVIRTSTNSLSGGS
jgi:hypothetical protein